MSRSIKKVIGHYCLCRIAPKRGKVITSRKIRRRARMLLRMQGENFDFAHNQDRKRGRKGSRCPDWGWDFFGDGYIRYFPGKTHSISRASPQVRGLPIAHRRWLFYQGIK